MALESGTYINSLNAANPASTDGLGQADDHIRLIKSAIKATFPNLDGPVTATVANLNNTTAIPSTLTDLGITDGSNGMVLSTDGAGNFSFVALPAGTTDTNYYVNGGSFSGTTLTLQRSGLSSISISGFPQAITDNSQIGNGAGYITSAPAQPTSLGGVGTYAWLGSTTNGQGFIAGTSYTASQHSLVYAGFQSTTVFSDDTAATIQGNAPPGSWRAMGNAANGTVPWPNREGSTLFLRIS